MRVNSTCPDGAGITDHRHANAFQGPHNGTRSFRVWLTGDERRFTARLNGTVTGPEGAKTLTVVEDFTYDDAARRTA